MNYIGNKLKRIRKVNRITQEELAEMLNTNRIRISNIENGKMEMTFNEAIRICEIFHISADSFFEERNLSSEDYISISSRYIKNKNISYDERREVLKKIHLDFESEYFNDIPLLNVLEKNKSIEKQAKSNKIDIDKIMRE